MSNIHGLSSGRAEKKNDQEEFSQGAAGQSGTAVWRPTNSDARGGAGGPAGGAGAGGRQDLMGDLLAQARAASASGPSAAQDRNIGQVTMYANGFIIGTGEFRDVKDAGNKAFLEQLKKGEVPDELEALCRKEWPDAGEVGVTLVDKSAETFTPPKPKFNFATSQGQSLGGGGAAAGAAAASAAAAFANAAPQRLQVDASQPTTTLQLVMGGRKIKETANQSATVLQLYQHFMSLSGLSGFELVAGFPPKSLTNPDLTLKEAGLLNGSITQREDRTPGERM